MAITAIILTVPNDFNRLRPLYSLLKENLPVDRVVFIGNQEVERFLTECSLGQGYEFLNEESLIPFESVRAVIENIFDGKQVTRGFVGWYYQQFLKLAYAANCEDQYYLAWDGDTVPIRQISFFKDGKPYMGMKNEYHKPYFDTLNKIFLEMHKAIKSSFIAEHMLFERQTVNEMLHEIMCAQHLNGATFFERILRTMEPEILNGNSFSEFETYGTYVAYRHPEKYILRRWNSFRHCGQYFRPDDITDAEIKWLAKDFPALTFEKGQEPSPEAAFFRNSEYQEKLSAKYILQVIQENSTSGYVEEWDD